MEFEWDEAKNQRNIQKHGVSFELAKRIFEGPILTAADTRQDYGEDRSISIEAVDGLALIVVVHTDRKGRVRLISARPASRRERQKYNEQTQ